MKSWDYCSSLLRARENKIIDFNYLNRLTDAPFPDGFIKLLKDTPYENYFETNNIIDYENILEKVMNDLYIEINNIIPDSTIIDNFYFQYDINNIKLILKSKLFGTEVNWELLSDYGKFEPEDIFSIIEEKLYFKLPERITESINYAEEQFYKLRNPQVIDFIIDSGFYNYIIESFNKNKIYEKILSFLRKTIDLENIKNIIRAKRLGIEKVIFNFIILNDGNISSDYFSELYNLNFTNIIDEIIKLPIGEKLKNGIDNIINEKGFSEFEKELDELILDELRNFKYITVGPEVIYEFIILKKLEIKNLKILFIGKLNSLKTEVIKSRFREVKI